INADSASIRLALAIIERLATHEIRPPQELIEFIGDPQQFNTMLYREMYVNIILKFSKYTNLPTPIVDDILQNCSKYTQDPQLLSEIATLISGKYTPALKNHIYYPKHIEYFEKETWPIITSRGRANSQQLRDFLEGIDQITPDQNKYINDQLDTMVDLGWDVFNPFISAINGSDLSRLYNVVKIFGDLAEYKIKPGHYNRDGQKVRISTALQNYNSLPLIKQFIRDVHLEPAKTVNALTSEIIDLNTNYSEKDKIFFEKKLRDIINIRDHWHEYAVSQQYNFTDKKDLLSWNQTDYMLWRQTIGTIDDNKITESLAVLSNAIYQSTAPNSYYPRDAQLLTILTVNNYDHGVLAQVATGEGKTLIIALMATIQAMNGHTVDIVTSSGYLARENYESMQRYYELIGISASHNINAVAGPNDCYKAQVVYGELLRFIGDQLNEVTDNIKYGRSLDKIIIDEVDSVLIDQITAKVLLTGNGMLGNHYLKSVFISLFDVGNDFGKLLYPLPNNNCGIGWPKSMLLESYPELNATPLDLTIIKDKGEDVIITEQYAEPCYKTADELIVDYATSHIFKFDRHFNERNTLIPQYFEKFATNQLESWVKGLHIAAASKLNVDYVKSNESITNPTAEKFTVIAPVDAKKTGTIRHRQHWGDGVHQFLQIRENIPLMSENLVSTFMSYCYYTKQFTGGIYGLTGTIGNADTISFFEEIYQVPAVVIPTYINKNLFKMPAVIVNNHTQWQGWRSIQFGLRRRRVLVSYFDASEWLTLALLVLPLLNILCILLMLLILRSVNKEQQHSTKQMEI
ncbi:MAG: hypothetical protein AAF153_01195, partial [Pseudomonadota bacterium]